MNFTGSRLAVFQGANEDPYLDDTGRESNAEKQPTSSGPEGCDVGEASRFAPLKRCKAGTLRLLINAVAGVVFRNSQTCLTAITRGRH